MVEKITNWAYLEPLVYEREFVHLSKVSRALGKNHTVVRQYLNYFERQGIVKKKNVGKMTLYKLAENNPLIVQVISLIEKEKLIRKCENLMLKEIIGFINSNKHAPVLIFGSFIDNPKKAEDVDILIIGQKGSHDFKKLEDKINKKIHLIRAESFDEVDSALKEEIRNKHLILNNVEEVVIWLI
jgi:DNA-binding transcriptional ArsR family regulator